MHTWFVFSFTVLILSSAVAQVRDYPRDLFNTAQPVSGATPFPNYDPYRLDKLYDKHHEIQLQIFDVINEAALRHDKRLKRALDLYGRDLGPIPSLAAAHYKWLFGDKSQLDWLLANDKKRGFGADSLTMLVFGYMDEWDRTIRRLKEHEAYLSNGEGGAASELLHRAIEIRKLLYGADRVDKAWNATQIK